MASWLDWSVIQGNQANLSGQIFGDDGSPLDLAALTLSLVIKPSESSNDADGDTYTPSVTSESLGKWSLEISGSRFTTPQTEWYRLDVLDGSSNHTTAYVGNVSTQAA